MQKIFNILKIQLAVTFAYRGTVFFWLCIHIIGFIVMYAFWSAIFSDRTELNGFQLMQMLQYILLTNMIREFVLVTPEYEMNEHIRDGKLGNSLVRPIAYPLHLLLASTFWHLIEIVFGVVIYTSLSYFILGHSMWDFPATLFLSIVPILLLGHIMCSLLSFILGTLAFWLTEASAFFYYKEIAILLTSGLFFPKATTPAWFQKIMEFLPFYPSIGLPAEILVHRTNTDIILPTFLHLSLWILGLGAIAYMLWKRGVKKFEAVGN